MEVDASRGPLRAFRQLPDPRAGNIRHMLFDMMVITLLGTLSKCNDWIEIVCWARANQKWLSTFLELPHGIPSHDTFGRLFARLSPLALEQCFVAWTSHMTVASLGQLLALDGKTLRRALQQAGGKAAVQMVSAWSHHNHLALAQLAVEEKSNEITAIPKLLEMLDLKGALVTIDAVGCQTAIAEKIVEKKGDYLLAVKQNQKELHEDVSFFLDEAIAAGFEGIPHSIHQTVDGDHGRIETRTCYVTGDVDWLRKRHPHWPKLAAIVCVQSVRQIKGKQEPKPTRRYYITSRAPDAQALQEAVRGHWGIENRLHWSLDVIFREDDSRTRKGHGAQNLNRIRKLALNLLRKDQTRPKDSIKTRRFLCSCDREYLLAIIQGA